MTRMTEIGERMKYCRKEWGFTQIQVAEYLGVKQSQIAKLEKGSRTLRYSATNKLVELFGVNYDWFVDGVGESGLDPLKRCKGVDCNVIVAMNKIIKDVKYLDSLLFGMEVKQKWVKEYMEM